MRFFLTSEQQMIVDTARRFAQEEIKPLVPQMDQNPIPGQFPIKELHHRYAELGLFGMFVPQQYGGMGLDFWTAALVNIELAKAICTAGVYHAAGNVPPALFCKLGTEEQKQTIVPAVIRGDMKLAFCFTEPDTGSNPAMLKTRATIDGDEYVLNGAKRFITNAHHAHLAIIFAKDWNNDVSLFITETDRKGFSVTKSWDKMGVRGLDLSDVYLEDVRIPKKNILGEPGSKFPELRWTMTLGKFFLACQCVAIMQRALDVSMEYASTKIIKIDQPQITAQAIRMYLAEMAIRLEASYLMLKQQADLMDKGIDVIKESAMVKQFCADNAIEVTRMGLEIHGPYGYMKDYEIERLYRDARAYTLLEGTSPLQKEIITSRLEKEYFGGKIASKTASKTAAPQGKEKAKV
jgi:alkylation response protein AidB-like acyl-CoA dehydrogenase